MITHIVIWKYRADVALETRAEHVRLLQGLAAQIEEAANLTAGADVLKLSRSYDTGLVAVFRDRAALDAYNDHPQHLKVVAFGKAISEHVASVDFES